MIDFALGLKLHQPPPYLIDFPVNEVCFPPEGHVSQPVVADGLFHADSYSSVVITPGCQIVVEAFASSVYIVRMCILGLDVVQEVKQYLRVSVEKKHLKPELLTHLLPVPRRVVHV